METTLRVVGDQADVARLLQAANAEPGLIHWTLFVRRGPIIFVIQRFDKLIGVIRRTRGPRKPYEMHVVLEWKPPGPALFQFHPNRVFFDSGAALRETHAVGTFNVVRCPARLPKPMAAQIYPGFLT